MPGYSEKRCVRKESSTTIWSISEKIHNRTDLTSSCCNNGYIEGDNGTVNPGYTPGNDPQTKDGCVVIERSHGTDRISFEGKSAKKPSCCNNGHIEGDNGTVNPGYTPGNDPQTKDGCVVIERSHGTDRISFEGKSAKNPRTPSIGHYIAVMTSCIMLLVLCGGIGSGIMFRGVISRYGPGACSIVGVLVASFGLLVSSFAPNITTVIVFTGVVASCGTSILYLVAYITVGRFFHEDAGLPLVILTIGSSIGQFTIPYIFEVCIAKYRWSGAFMIISGITLNCAAGGIIIYFSKRYYVTGNDKKSCGVKRRVCKMSLLNDGVMVLILINAFLFQLTGIIEILFMVDIMTSRGYPREAGSLIITYIGFGNFAGRLIGILIRFKCANIPTIYHWVYLWPLFALCHGLFVSLFDYTLLVCTSIAYGVLYGILVAQGPAIILEVSGQKAYPLAIALMNLCDGSGSFLAGVLGGIVKDTFGNYYIAFYAAIATSLYTTVTSICIAVVLRRRRHLATINTAM